MKTVISILIIVISAHVINGQWIKQSVNTTASFRGLSVVNEKVIWASGTDGTVIRTIDGGKIWKVMTVPGVEKLDFRDIEAFDANTAYILSIGNGESSRIYKTIDGGKTWREQFRNKNEKAFFDAIACEPPDYCIALSDPVEGKFVLILTYDGGENWKPMPMSRLAPAAVTNEAAFAASGTCLIFSPTGMKMFVTGGSEARVFRGGLTHDSGWAWEPVPTPIIHGTSGSGIFSIAMWDKSMWEDGRSSILNGVIVGGNYEKPDEAKDNLAFTSDGGRTWKLGSGLSGYRSSVTYIDKKTIIAVGTNGTDITRDGGKTWKVFGKENLNAVQSKGKRATWAVGSKGTVVKMK